jgi:hypothetical protein
LDALRRARIPSRAGMGASGRAGRPEPTRIVELRGESTAHASVFSHVSKAGWSAPLDSSLDLDNTLVIAFGASGLLDAPAPVEDVPAAYPWARMLGCSTSGEVRGRRIHDDSLAVAVARLDRVGLREASAPVGSAADSFSAGESIARRRQADDLRAVLVASDGLLVNGSELVRGLNAVLSPEVVVPGGLAGDGDRDRFQRTWVLDQRRIRAGCFSAIGLYGAALSVGHGSKGGGTRSVSSGGSRPPRATCSTNWTTARRSRSARNAWETARSDFPLRHCSSRSPCAPIPPTTGVSCARSWPWTKRSSR